MKNTKTDLVFFLFVYIGTLIAQGMTYMFTFIAFHAMKFSGWEWIYIAPYLFAQTIAFGAYKREITKSMLA